MALKVGGRVVDGPKTTILVIPRQDGDIPFKFISITNAEGFDALLPFPKPPRSFKVGVGMIENVEDAGYKRKVEARGEKRADWFFINSARPSEIEWEHVKYEDPETWHLWRDELEKAGFSVAERDAIYGAFLETNTLSQHMVDEARNRFLASQALALLGAASSQATELSNTVNGGPVSDGDCAPMG